MLRFSLRQFIWRQSSFVDLPGEGEEKMMIFLSLLLLLLPVPNFLFSSSSSSSGILTGLLFASLFLKKCQNSPTQKMHHVARPSWFSPPFGVTLRFVFRWRIPILFLTPPSCLGGGGISRAEGRKKKKKTGPLLLPSLLLPSLLLSPLE